MLAVEYLEYGFGVRGRRVRVRRGQGDRQTHWPTRAASAVAGALSVHVAHQRTRPAHRASGLSPGFRLTAADLANADEVPDRTPTALGDLTG
ncbi:hypothetical protein [Streptomyces sp. NPDC002550]